MLMTVVASATRNGGTECSCSNADGIPAGLDPATIRLTAANLLCSSG